MEKEIVGQAYMQGLQRHSEWLQAVVDGRAIEMP